MLAIILPAIVIFIVTTAWGLLRQSDWAVLKRAAETPNVQKVVVTDSKVADSVPDPRVTIDTRRMP
jgi:hypothetical protein